MEELCCWGCVVVIDSNEVEQLWCCGGDDVMKVHTRNAPFWGQLPIANNVPPAK
jgi:hypothetical protein